MSAIRTALVALTLAAGALPAQATRPYSDRLAVLGGLTQPLVFGGGNVEVQYQTSRFIVEYSHGWNLDLDNIEGSLEQAERDASMSLRMPWTTGGGVGVRLTDRMHVTLDAKVHRVEAGLPGGTPARYTTTTLGPALAYAIPVWRGLVVQPVVRYWGNVATSLDGGRTTLRGAGGTSLSHKAITQGPGGFNANVKVGWRF